MIILGAKFIRYLSIKKGNRGSDIAGNIAYRFNKNILKKLAKNINHIVVITGTNGKTTTANLIASTIKEIDPNYIHNNEGANLLTGIISAFIINKPLFSKTKAKYAILEVDEGSIPKVLEQLNIDALIVTNFFRDQLDRYGEIDILVQKIKSSYKNSTKLILNGNDPFCVRLQNDNSSFFGFENSIEIFDKGNVSESKTCPNCQNNLVYDHVFYSQLGIFTCNCGFKTPLLYHSAKQIEKFQLTTSHGVFNHNLDGNYNAFNLLAAIACLDFLKIPKQTISNGILNYYSNDGRMQEFKINNNHHTLNLVKNPSGMNVSIDTILDAKKTNIVFILNDLVLDGLDISWIWDADFERLPHINANYFVCGTRCDDMAIRLKIAHIPIKNIKINSNFEEIIDQVLKEPTFIISSYTALEKTKKLLEMRSL